jgi:mutator protein MutT
MRQKISVRAIIQQDQKTLLVRRAVGRESILGKFELPGGSIDQGEQPEDALRRYLENDIGLTARGATLLDAVSYIDHDDRDTQYIFLIYIASLETEEKKLSLNGKYDRYVWRRQGDVSTKEVTDSTNLLLDVTRQDTSGHTEPSVVAATPSVTSVPGQVVVYSDGGSRGNPGPSAAGFVILNGRDEVIAQGGMYLGITTNNLAEYQGLLLGLEKAFELHARVIDFRLDSLLVVNQMNGIYRIKNRELWPVHERIRELLTQFDRVTFTHIRREFNQLADGMVNKILNQHADEVPSQMVQ